MSKAAFFSSYNVLRSVVFDIGRRHPDLFDMGLGCDGDMYSTNPFALADPEHAKCRRNALPHNSTHPYPESTGWCIDIWNFYCAQAHVTSYNHGDYKYIIVPRSGMGLSTSGRLAKLLAHSGAVILLATGSYYYHFSARLEPWVHFVPIANNLADIVEKVRWLQSHDDLAQQIAKNGMAFGDSYLRKEDYLCYTAAALKAAADTFKGTTALEPSTPKAICDVMHCNLFAT